MTLNQAIDQDYREYIALHVHDQDLKDALKYQERTPLFIHNLAKQLARVKNLRRDMIKTAVYDMTGIFIKAVQQHKEEAQMSDMEKIKRRHDHEVMKQMDAAATELAKQLDVVTHGQSGKTH